MNKLSLMVFVSCVSLMLVGCGVNPAKPKDEVKLENTILVHPELPDPITNYKIKWEVLLLKNKVYVGTTYNDSLEMRKMLEDMKRYIKESNSIMCYYRKELKEEFCKNYQKENNK